MKKNACEYHKDLDNFLDGTLEPERRNVVASHVDSCAGCKAAVEAATELRKLIQCAAQDNDVPDLWSSIKEKLPQLCQVVREDLSAYIDSELAAEGISAIDSHLTMCRPCGRQLEHFNAVDRLLARGFALPASIAVDLWPQLQLHLVEDCAVIAHELSAYLDREVDQSRHRAITTHLTGCTECSAQILSTAYLGERLRSSYAPDLRQGFDIWQDVSEKIKIVPIRPQSFTLNWDYLLSYSRRHLVAVAVVVGLTGILISSIIVMSQNASTRDASAEAYLLDSLLADTANTAEAVVYEEPR